MPVVNESWSLSFFETVVIDFTSSAYLDHCSHKKPEDKVIKNTMTMKIIGYKAKIDDTNCTVIFKNLDNQDLTLKKC